MTGVGLIFVGLGGDFWRRCESQGKSGRGSESAFVDCNASNALAILVRVRSLGYLSSCSKLKIVSIRLLNSKVSGRSPTVCCNGLARHQTRGWDWGITLQNARRSEFDQRGKLGSVRQLGAEGYLRTPNR